MSALDARLMSCTSIATVTTALAAIAAGASLSAVSREFGINRSTLRAWRDCPADAGHRDVQGATDVRSMSESYAALLGYYLGDGCLSRAARYYVLRVSCDTKYPKIIADVEQVIDRVRPGHRTFRVHGPGVIVVQSNWVHWPCLFPQHGPGAEARTALAMADWQWFDTIAKNPADFLRGLFHSDGCRAKNWARQVVAGEKKRYEYPRWHFTNESAEIMTLVPRSA